MIISLSVYYTELICFVIKLIKYKQNTIEVDGRNFLGFYTTRYGID